MNAIFQTGGKQYLVQKGAKLQIEKLKAEEGETVTFDKVLFTGAGDKFQVGSPYITSAVVTAKVLAQGRGRKIHVLKYKPKSKYRRKIGHRQAFTEVEIISI